MALAESTAPRGCSASVWVHSPRGVVCIGHDDGQPSLRDDPLCRFLPQRPEHTLTEALADAVFDDDFERVVELVDKQGASVWEKPQRGRHNGVHPLALAARGGRSSTILRFLLERGAAGKEHRRMDAAVHAWAATFVDIAEFEAECRAKLRLLVAYQADVNASNEHTGETPLHVAANLFERHRSQGASSNINRWTTSRSDSAKFKYTLLLKARADPAMRDRRFKTPLDYVSPGFWEELPRLDDCLVEPF
eukprot:TRINITY_DN50421_c0_g1_i1.p1 TRINITY_DN50421_c0_g1~~TRINITY_DN50421_c0_g1_i1.p1  ORF type:complete len:249 (+),score=33.33 TRINITY_DN50421_c0_g1_i1:111-857(+)